MVEMVVTIKKEKDSYAGTRYQVRCSVCGESDYTDSKSEAERVKADHISRVHGSGNKGIPEW